jgi:hypothetical protein
MTVRIVWKQRESLRSIEKQARRTLDPLDRLRYVRNRMDSMDLAELRQWPVRRIATMVAAALVAALLVWPIH